MRDLPHTIGQVASIVRCIGGALLQLPARVCDIQSDRPLALPLSGRQKAVVRMFVEGGFIAEIATALRRHRRTVIRQNHDAPKTLGVTNDHGLFSPV